MAESQVLKPTGENRNKQKSIFENAKDHSSGGKRKSMGTSSVCDQFARKMLTNSVLDQLGYSASYADKLQTGFVRH